MENTKKSLLKWSDIFEVYRKIREVERGDTTVNFVAGVNVAIVPADVCRENLQTVVNVLQKEIKLLDAIVELKNKNEELSIHVNRLQNALDAMGTSEENFVSRDTVKKTFSVNGVRYGVIREDTPGMPAKYFRKNDSSTSEWVEITPSEYTRASTSIEPIIPNINN